MRQTAIVIEVVIQIGLPLVLAIWAIKHYKLSWKIFFIGQLFFLLSQVLESPFRMAAGSSTMMLGTYGVIVAMSLIAGIGEELARYLALRFIPMLKKGSSFGTTMLFGLGHGGTESILIGLSVASMAWLIYMADPKTLAALPPEYVSGFTSTSWYYFLLGGLERALTLVIQLGFTFIVAMVFIKRDIRFLFLAIAVHFVVDAASVSTLTLTRSIVAAEGVVLVMAVIAGGWILWFRQHISTVEDETDKQVEIPEGGYDELGP